MNKWFAALAGLCVTVPVLAQMEPPAALAAATDPLKVIYRISGVRDDGDAGGAGIATSLVCTNVSTVPERVKFRVFDRLGVLAGSDIVTLDPNRTHTASTHLTASFFDDDSLSATVVLNQGSAIISATTTKVICTAMIVDAAAPTPAGIALHMVRYNATPNTLE